jgi:hypothetical protein
MSKQTMLTASAMTALCALAMFSLQAKAQSQEQTRQEPSQQGMVAVRDAQTGKMRAPTPDELKALRVPAASAAAPATPDGARPRPQALAPRRDGAQGVRLGEKNMVHEVVTRGADGKLSTECVHGDAGADAALAGAHAAQRSVPTQHKEHAHEAR